VWKKSVDGKKLLPSLCNIKEQKSNLDAAWNHRGDKFCVGATSGHVYTGTWDNDVQFWVVVSVTAEPPLGKPLHKASVTSVRFDPGSGRVVASASADGKVIITSCYDSEIDNDGTGPFAGVTNEENETLFTFKSNVWNNTLAWSPSSTTLAFASHDCEMHFIEFTAENV
jgi:WD40 repeat protein